MVGRKHVATVIDWYSRKILAWRVSISIDTAFCLEAVEEALVLRISVIVTARFG